MIAPRDPMAPADRARLHAAARQIEALVLEQLVQASRAFTGGDGAGSAVRADLFAEALADSLAQGGGLGLAKQIEQGLGAPAGAGPGAPPAPSRSAAPAVTSALGSRQDPFDGDLTRHEGVPLAAPEAAPAGALRKYARRADGVIDS